jgi:C-terminal processing protease CtpA/Prc
MHRVEAGTIVVMTMLSIVVQASAGEGAMKLGSGERSWLFQSEPLITGIRRDGPADGKLRSGDVIVGIDGMLIMTRQAGVRFANITAGEPVDITVRRGRGTIIETIVPEEVPSGESVKIPGFDLSDTEALLRLSKSIESLARLSSESSDDGELGEAPDAVGLREPAGLPEEGIPPIGWLGFGLKFSGSVVLQRSDGGPARWSFDSPPKVVSVESDGPADRAGLKRGDVLTHIDGLQLDGRKGEKRFSAVEPGQSVTWTVRRNGAKRTIVMVAEERP